MACIQSPIVRSELGYEYVYYRPSEEILELNIVKRIKKWRAIIVAWKDGPRDRPSARFTTFCRAICLHPPQSLEVVLMEHHYDKFDDSGNSYTDDKIRQRLRPLELLRNVKSLQIRNNIWTTHSRLIGGAPPIQINPDLVSDLKSLVEGNSPPERVFRMYEQLLSYAPCFERIDKFKIQLSLSYIQERSSHHEFGCGEEIESNAEDEDEAVALRSPYLAVSGEDPHPVERALSQANYTSSGFPEDHEIDCMFFDARDAVLSYLEPQYQRIAAAGREMAEFVKDIKRQNRFLDPTSRTTQGAYLEVFADGLIFLEAYAKSFNRDVPRALQPRFRVKKREIDIIYKSMHREQLLKQLDSWVEGFRRVKHTVRSQVELDKFTKWFREAVDDMEAQHSQIQQARKALLDYDFDDTGCGIDLELWKTEEKIDWTVREPESLKPDMDDFQEILTIEGEDGGREL